MQARSEEAPSAQSIKGREGELVSVRVCVEARLLEALLDALAGLSFPTNPQIFHQAGIGHVYPDGREDIRPTTMVEFPAFSNHLAQVRDALAAADLPPDSLRVRGMFEKIHSERDAVPAPEGADYTRIKFYRRIPHA
jgi:hypothetical protein